MTHKVVFVGDSGVGKTAIIHAWQRDVFGRTQVTIGAAEFKIDVPVSGTVVKLLVWDTAGQDTYAALVPHYVRQAKGCVLTFSLVDELSLESIPQWARLVNEHESIPHLFVVGNKLDLTDRRQVSEERGQEIADSVGATYFETSAKTGNGIEQLFSDVAMKVDLHGPPADVNLSVPLSTMSLDKKYGGGCCS
jgi:small GTP-binding protein